MEVMAPAAALRHLRRERLTPRRGPSLPHPPSHSLRKSKNSLGFAQFVYVQLVGQHEEDDDAARQLSLALRGRIVYSNNVVDWVGVFLVTKDF